MRHIKKYYESIENDFNYKEKLNIIKSKYTKELNELNDECRHNIEESLLYILDSYDSVLNKSHINVYDMFNDFYQYEYKITLTNKDFTDRSTIIDNFKRAFDKLKLNLGLEFPENDFSVDLDDIRLSVGGSMIICFSEFEEYILTKKISSKVYVNLIINP